MFLCLIIQVKKRKFRTNFIEAYIFFLTAQRLIGESQLCDWEPLGNNVAFCTPDFFNECNWRWASIQEVEECVRWKRSWPLVLSDAISQRQSAFLVGFKAARRPEGNPGGGGHAQSKPLQMDYAEQFADHRSQPRPLPPFPPPPSLMFLILVLWTVC